MNKSLLINFILESGYLSEADLDLYKNEIDCRFYHFGAHFDNSFESNLSISSKIKSYFIFIFKFIYVFSMSFIQKKNNKPVILSSSYFNINKEFENKGFRVTRPPWRYSHSLNNIFDYKYFWLTNIIQFDFKYRSLAYLLSDKFKNKIEKYKYYTKRFIIKNNVKAIALPADRTFFERIILSLSNELNIPNFIFVHGLQLYLNKKDFSRSAYLVVWGNESKKDFVKNNFAESKILVSGQPRFSFKKYHKLRNNLENILVISSSLSGANPDSDYIQNLSDRSNSIYYLYSIEYILKKFGVKKVRFRPHPSESFNWYKLHINTLFYEIDYNNISNSLHNSSLVIGPTSTILSDSLLHGVNYLVYNPLNQFGMSLTGAPISPIYKGDNIKVPVALSEKDLFEYIKYQKCIDISILDDLVGANFSLDEVLGKIN